MEASTCSKNAVIARNSCSLRIFWLVSLGAFMCVNYSSAGFVWMRLQPFHVKACHGLKQDLQTKRK